MYSLYRSEFSKGSSGIMVWSGNIEDFNIGPVGCAVKRKTNGETSWCDTIRSKRSYKTP